MNYVYLTWFMLFIIFYLYGSISASDIPEIKSIDTQTVDKKIPTFIDVLEEDFRNETWGEDEKPCHDLILLILSNVRNATLWSTWVWDSMQLPSGILYGSRYHLGNFDECLRPPWLHSHPKLRTQYCLADVQLTKSKPRKAVQDFDPYGSVKPYINTLTKYHQVFNVVTWGVCMPTTCKPHSISKFLKILHKNSHLGHISHDPVITVDSCQVAGSHQYSTAFYAFWLLMLLLILIAIISTCYVNKDSQHSDSAVTLITNAFCIKRNLNDLVKEAKDDIPVLHGMRVLSSSLIVLVHCFLFLYSSPVGNGLDIDKEQAQLYLTTISISANRAALLFSFPLITLTFFELWVLKVIELLPQALHLEIVVDTFLLMSGLLHAKGLMSKRQNPIMGLVKRYVRLIGPYALVVFYASKVAWHGGNGPMYPRLVGDSLAKMCADNGWLNLLMINNYVKSNEMCYPVTWYIACDYQLTILGTILFWMYYRDRRVGKLVFAALAVLAVILPGLATYWNNLHGLIVYNVDSGINYLKSEEFSSTYTSSLHRMAPYLIGLAMGYTMTTYKPVQYRNTIPKKWSNIIFVLAVTGFLLPLVLAGMLITSGEYNVINEAIFAATNRIIWALAINTYIILAEYGSTPSIFFAGALRFLSWPVWVPLSRLTYGLYMVHLLIIARTLFTTRTPLQEDVFATISYTFGVVCVGFVFSLLIWLFVQAPFVNLMNIVLDRKKKPIKVAQN